MTFHVNPFTKRTAKALTRLLSTCASKIQLNRKQHKCLQEKNKKRKEKYSQLFTLWVNSFLPVYVLFSNDGYVFDKELIFIFW